MNILFLLGCIMYAYEAPVRTSPVYYSESHYHTNVMVTPPTYHRVWVNGHYSIRGNWVPGHWRQQPYDRPRAPRNRDCHVHADGRTHCGRH
jgi:hypothetical protein